MCNRKKTNVKQSFVIFQFKDNSCIFWETNIATLRHWRRLYSVDLEVWSKPAKRARIKRIASKCARNFDWDWQRVNAFFHCVTLTRVLLPQIISYSDTKVPVLVAMECKRASVLYVYELIFLLHPSRSTEYKVPAQRFWPGWSLIADWMTSCHM